MSPYTVVVPVRPARRPLRERVLGELGLAYARLRWGHSTPGGRVIPARHPMRVTHAHGRWYVCHRLPPQATALEPAVLVCEPL